MTRSPASPHPGGGLSALTHAGTSQNDLVGLDGATLQNDGRGLASRTVGSPSTYYVRANDGSVISEKTGTTRRSLFGDERGSIVRQIDTSGATTASYTYDPYGRNLDTGHPVFGYVSGVRAPGGLTHYGARYYESQTGRWTQQDPLNQALDVSQANRFAYTGNNPVHFVDPTGSFRVLKDLFPDPTILYLFSRDETKIIAAGGGAVIALIPGGVASIAGAAAGTAAAEGTSGPNGVCAGVRVKFSEGGKPKPFTYSCSSY